MAAVAARSSANNSPHLSANGKGMTASPRASAINNSSESQSKDAPATTTTAAAGDSKTDIPTINKPADEKIDTTAPATNAPLAPPPKPTQNGEGGADYFGGQHFSKEPNPFESAFGGGGSAETPGKTQLPGVTSLTSPAPLLPGNTPAWPGSLRSGPLSPAMLAGPTGSNDYFNSDHHFGGSFPTPNESSLRTGLTPGGGGSMFPQPSPNSQALYNQLQSGGATPGTLDFHRTAMTARAQTQAGTYGITANGATSQPQSNPNIQPDLDSKPYTSSNNNAQSHDGQDPFNSHQANDATSAASGLFMLAQAGGQQRNGSQNFQMNQQQQQQQNFASSTSEARAAKHNSVASASTQGVPGDYSDGSNDAKPQARTRGGKKGASTGKAASTGKRKTEETPSKASNKKVRAESEDMDDMDDMEEETGADGKKMTDEEKRKNFLERNRVAALKCRQRKKQWLANLQQKVEIFSSENDALAATVTQLREEIVGLKTLLLAHKDCPVSQAQGISGMAMQQIASDAHQYANPYGMAMGPNGPQGQMPQASMQRR